MEYDGGELEHYEGENMKRLKQFTVTTILSMIGYTSGFCFAGVESRPNILLVMTDDQGYGDLGFHGNDKIDTPVLDRLAVQSVRFDRFFVSPYCTPTRAALMTGRYPLRTGAAAVTRGLETVRSEEVTVAEVLRSAGYATGCFGKWHIGEHYPSHPNGQGFDEFFGMPQGHWDNYFDPMLEHNGRMVQTHGFITDVLTDHALQFIEQHRDRPFFCYVPYNAPTHRIRSRIGTSTSTSPGDWTRVSQRSTAWSRTLTRTWRGY